MREKWNGASKYIVYGLIGCFFVLFVHFYWQYINLAKSTAPIMDFWHWTAVYGEKMHNGTIGFTDFFFSDQGEHIQPLIMAVQMLILNATSYDVACLVEWGAVIRILLTGVLAAVFLWEYRKRVSDHKLLTLFTACILICSVLNLNQWEMTTEPFSLGNVMRVAMYYISFAWAAVFLLGFENRKLKGNIAHGFLLGCYCAFLSVFVSSAYFVGHLPAIGLAFVWVLYRNRKQWKQYLIPFALWFGISLCGAIAYYWLYSLGGRQNAAIDATLQEAVDLLLQGYVIYWASAFLPQTVAEQTGMLPYYMLGVPIVAYSICITVCYLRRNPDKANLFPVMCVLYASLVGLVIAWGRVGQFSAAGMSASRYVVESSVGLAGMAWMSYDVFSCGLKNRWKSAVKWSVVLGVLLLFQYSVKVEDGIAVYRGAYYESIKEAMLNVDDYTDEELAFTQASGQDVRYCVQFFKENNLSIFGEEESR